MDVIKFRRYTPDGFLHSYIKVKKSIFDIVFSYRYITTYERKLIIYICHCLNIDNFNLEITDNNNLLYNETNIDVYHNKQKLFSINHKYKQQIYTDLLTNQEYFDQVLDNDIFDVYEIIFVNYSKHLIFNCIDIHDSYNYISQNVKKIIDNVIIKSYLLWMTSDYASHNLMKAIPQDVSRYIISSFL